MDAKFANGEWVICDGDSHSKEVTITTEERESSLTVPICEMDIRFTGDIGLEQVANAHLIAAAPEMYEFIETVAAGKDADLEALKYMAVSWARSAETLLAKARGEA